MSEEHVVDNQMRKSKKPFYFNTSEHLLRLGRESFHEPPVTRKLLHKWPTAKWLMKLGDIRDGLALPLTLVW